MNNFFLKTRLKTNSFWLSVLLCTIVLFNSCKEGTILPPDLVPAVDNINTFQEDTFTVITTTVMKDSLLTGGIFNFVDRNADADYSHAIGSITTDAIFGKTVAGVYLQVRPPNPKFEFTGTSRTIDSVVLGVNYLQAHTFGDTSAAVPMQSFSLYRTTDNLVVDSPYYEFNTVPYTAADLLATIPVNFYTLTDSPIINGVKLRPQIRFNMPGTSPFVNDLDMQSATTGFLDYDAFTAWLGGFYIEPTDTNVMASTLGYFDTDNAAMYVYYRFTNVDNKDDTAVAVFPFDPANNVRFNHITRDYSGTPAQNFISPSNAQTSPGDSLLFVQGEPGLASIISFPHIGAFPNAIINKAELTFTVVSLNNFTDTANFNIPDRFQLLYVNENGEDEILRDYFDVGTNRVGGFRESVTIGAFQFTQYKFNISNTIQEAVTTQNSNFKLKMSGAASDFPANRRVVLKGSGSGIALEKPKLNIIFTKIQR